MMPSNHISTIEKNLLWLMVLYLKTSVLLSQVSRDKAVLQDYTLLIWELTKLYTELGNLFSGQA